MQLYTIMPLDLKHIDEICEDIKQQYETGVATCALFKMTLVPEGNPVSDKVTPLCERYDEFKKRLADIGVPNGILVQASIGHGWVLGEMFPYQRYVNFNDGKKINTCCPYDLGFREYIKNVFKKIAEHNPDCIMVDDDLRLMTARGQGCGCPLHIEKFNQYAGTSFKREELWGILQSDVKEADVYSDIMVKVQGESLIDTARIMREGIDSINPNIPASYCCVGENTEFAYEIAAELAGKGNPIVVRINNGHYCIDGNHEFTNSFYRAAQSVAKLKGKADVLLAETDTCPQNRYSTGAMTMHTQFVGTILEGVAGAKHWITRLEAFEPESGKAYRKVLGKYRGFYETLAKIVLLLKWRGFRIPVSEKQYYGFKRDMFNIPNAWATHVIERLGLPMYFSSDYSGVTCFEGNTVLSYTDDEILEMLKGKMFLASDAAKCLIERGFGEFLGVDIREWNGKTPTAEILYINNNVEAVQKNCKEIVPLSDEVKIDSGVYNSIDKENYTYLYPGTTTYKNKLGGTVFVFAGTPLAEFQLGHIFSFLNYSRKQQFISMLESVGELVAYYPGDEEVYFKVADMPDGKTFCAIFNLGCDVIEELCLKTEKHINTVELLTPNGEWENVGFIQHNNNVQTKIECRTLEPVILLLS